MRQQYATQNLDTMRLGFIGALLCASSIFSAYATQTEQPQAKYVFYFIGDGMGMGHVNAAEHYNRDVLHNDTPLLMLTFPYAGQARTYSASDPITDSAAAGTALSTGVKTRNYMVGMAPDTTDVQSISADFMRSGRAVGIVTSVAGDDATPAAFYAHAPERGMKQKISGYAPTSGVSFFGAPVFKGMTDADGQPSSWLADMRNAGYTVVHTFGEYLNTARGSERVLMLAEKAAGEQLGYTLDSIPGALTLQELTETALDALQTDPDGFFLMVEGGNIDWAAHANDGASVIKEVINFQNAIDVAYRFYQSHPDETLIVITADHDTGGMALGRADNTKKMRLDLIDFQKISKDRFAEWCRNDLKGKQITWPEMRRFIADNLGIDSGIRLTEEEEKAIRKSFDDTFITRRATDEKTLYNDFNRFTADLYNILNRHYGIAFTSPSHTANFVPVYAIGVGAEYFGRNLNNIEIPMEILRAAGLTR